MAVLKLNVMKKVILTKRLHEGGEKEKPTVSENTKKVKSEETGNNDNDNNPTIDNDTTMDTGEPEAGNLVIDDDVETVEDDEYPLDLSKGAEERQEGRGNITMFTGVPESFITKEVKQVVPCKHNSRKRFYGKKEGFTRAQLHEKRSGTYRREYEQFTKAMKEVDRDCDEEKRDFDYIKNKNDVINEKNASTRGRLLVSKAAAIKVIGDSVEAIDEENGKEKVKITMVRSIETRTFIVHQGRNNRQGQEILTVFTREEINHKEDKPQVFSNPVAGDGWARP